MTYQIHIQCLFIHDLPIKFRIFNYSSSVFSVRLDNLLDTVRSQINSTIQDIRTMKLVEMH